MTSMHTTGIPASFDAGVTPLDVKTFGVTDVDTASSCSTSNARVLLHTSDRLVSRFFGLTYNLIISNANTRQDALEAVYALLDEAERLLKQAQKINDAASWNMARIVMNVQLKGRFTGIKGLRILLPELPGVMRSAFSALTTEVFGNSGVVGVGNLVRNESAPLPLATGDDSNGKKAVQQEWERHRVQAEKYLNESTRVVEKCSGGKSERSMMPIKRSLRHVTLEIGSGSPLVVPSPSLPDVRVAPRHRRF